MFDQYVAGFLDGEGCFGIYKNNKGGIDAGISVGVTYKPILELIKKEYGGILYKTKAGTNKTIWRWKIYGDPAINMISRVAMYMFEKQYQAILLKSYLCWRAEQPRWDHYKDIKTNWSNVYWIVDEMKRLKKEERFV